MWPLKRTAVAITWCVKIKIANTTFAGSVWVSWDNILERIEHFSVNWLIVGSWEPHGSSWYNCNRYDEDEAKAARDAQEKLRSSLARFVWECTFISCMNQSSIEFHFSDICITTIVIWITCNRWNSSTNCTIASRRKWRRCNSITCHGSRLVSSKY